MHGPKIFSLSPLFAKRKCLLVVERSEVDRRYQSILEQSTEVIYEADIDGRWTYLNPAWSKLTANVVSQD